MGKIRGLAAVLAGEHPPEERLMRLLDRVGLRHDSQGPGARRVALARPGMATARSHPQGFLVVSLTAPEIDREVALSFLWEALMRFEGQFGYATTAEVEVGEVWFDAEVAAPMREERVDQLDRMEHPIRMFSAELLDRLEYPHPWRILRADTRGALVATEPAILARWLARLSALEGQPEEAEEEP
ncbi:MAG: hypothetical protein AB1758_22805 [Candidatus Eremiobacterota bacterium]